MGKGSPEDGVEFISFDTPKGGSINQTAIQRKIEAEQAVTTFWKEATTLVQTLQRVAGLIANELEADAKRRPR